MKYEVPTREGFVCVEVRVWFPEGQRLTVRGYLDNMEIENNIVEFLDGSVMPVPERATMSLKMRRAAWKKRRTE